MIIHRGYLILTCADAEVDERNSWGRSAFHYHSMWARQNFKTTFGRPLLRRKTSSASGRQRRPTFDFGIPCRLPNRLERTCSDEWVCEDQSPETLMRSVKNKACTKQSHMMPLRLQKASVRSKISFGSRASNPCGQMKLVRAIDFLGARSSSGILCPVHPLAYSGR